MPRHDAQQIIDNIERVLEEENALAQADGGTIEAGRLRQARTAEYQRSLYRTLDKDLFKKLRNFQDVDRVPEGARFGPMKRIWGRLLRLVSQRQAAYNFNNIGTLQLMANHIDMLQTRLRALEDGQTRPFGMSALEGSEASRLGHLVSQHLHGLHKNVDFISRNMGEVTKTLTQLLDNLSGLSGRLNQLNLKQGDFYGEISAARHEVTRIWTELGLVYESIDNRAEDLWQGLDERDTQLQLNTEATQKLHGQTSSLEMNMRELKARLLVLTEQLTIHQEMLEAFEQRVAAETPRRREAPKVEGAPIDRAEAPRELAAPEQPKSSHFLGEGSAGAARLVQKQLDLAYLRFQRQFRADEEELRRRQGEYIRLLDRHLRVAPGQTPRLLDVACGDGVFLDLVREHGWTGVGVDINEAMVKQGVTRGLEIACEDAIAFLARQEAKSYDAISAFQFVEHLPPVVIMKMLKECYAALKPGGLLLVETINPHTLKALHWYHLDLSHERLVFPEMLALLSETAGFHIEEWEGINRVAESDRLKEEGTAVELENLKKLNSFLFGDQDYYLLARRPGGKISDED